MKYIQKYKYFINENNNSYEINENTFNDLIIENCGTVKDIFSDQIN